MTSTAIAIAPAQRAASGDEPTWRPFRAELQADLVRYLRAHKLRERRTAEARELRDAIEADPDWRHASAAEREAAIHAALDSLRAARRDLQEAIVRVLREDVQAAVEAFAAFDVGAPRELRVAARAFLQQSSAPGDASRGFGLGAAADLIPWIPSRRGRCVATYPARATLEAVDPTRKAGVRLGSTSSRRPRPTLTLAQLRRVEEHIVMLARARGEKSDVALATVGLKRSAVKQRRRRARKGATQL